MPTFQSNFGALFALSGGGGGEDLAATLAIGNTTGGTGIEFTAGDPLLFNQNATVPGGAPGATQGVLWVRDDAPTTLIFTDGAGTDWLIGGSGADTLQQAYDAGAAIVTNATAGTFDISGTEAISLDASMASNFTVAGSTLTLATTTSGSITISGATGATPGALLQSSGASTAAGTAGASISLSAGDNAIVAATANGGSINLTAGNVTDGGSSGDGGDINLTPGVASGSGADGQVLVTGALEVTGKLTVGGMIDPPGMTMTESSTNPGAVAAGTGTIWVRDDSPTTLIFTDSIGGDTMLGGGSGALTGIPGNTYEDLLFYMDSADRNSYPSTGTTVTDLQGNGTAGTLTGVTFEDNAFNFTSTGSGDNISFTKGATLDDIFAAGGTVMVWARLADDGEAAEGILVDTSNDVDAGWWIATVGASAGHVSIRFQRNWSTSTGGTWTSDQVTQPWSGGSDDAVHKGSWTSITIQYSDTAAGNQPTFYINGTVVPNTQNTAASGAAQSDAGNPITIGNIGTGLDRALDGQVAVVLMWDRTLNPDEVQRAHSAFSARFGQGFRGGDGRLIGSAANADISGQDIWIRGGDSHTTTNSEAEGGHVYLVAGDHLGGGNAAAGRVYIASGSGGGNVSFSGDILIESGENALDSNVTIQVGDQNTTNTPGVMTVRGGDNYGSGGTGAVLIRSGARQPTGGTGALITVRGADGSDPTSPAGSMTGGAAVFRAGDGRAGGSGGALTVRAGEAGSTGGSGGSFTMSSGSVTSGNSAAGDITITSGSTPGVGFPGDITTTSGSATGNARGGNIAFVTGNAASTSASLPAGNFTVTTGDSTASGAAASSGGGSVSFTLGSSNKTVTTSPGGSFTVTAGAGVANSANSRGGSVTMTGGDVTGSTAGAIAGSISLTGGQATGAAGTSGSVTIAGAAAGVSGGTAGSAIIMSGNGLGSIGGPVTVTSGTGEGAFDGGAIGITAGDSGGGATGNGGTVTISAGDAASTDGDGGDIILNPGSLTGTGADGEVIINGKLMVTGGIDPTYLGLNEQASKPITAAGGIGYLWVDNNTPTRLVYTDDANSDFTIAGSGVGTSLQTAYAFGNTIVTNATDGAFDVSGTEAISLDSSSASNLTVDTGGLTLSTTTSGTLLVDAVALLDVNAGANMDIDVTGSIDMLSTGAFSIDGTGASNVTTDAGTLTLSTTSSGDVALSSAADITLTPASGQTTSISGPRTSVNRVQHDQGTALVAGDFALSAGWGTTASIVSVTGTDSRFILEWNSTGTSQAQNPTITLTFADGAWPNAPFPIFVDNGSIDGGGGYFAPQFELTSISTTQAVWTLRAAAANGSSVAYTPNAADTWQAICHIMG